MKDYNCILFVYLVCADVDQELKTVKQNYGISIGVLVTVTVLVAVSSICGICYIIKWKKYPCSGYETVPGKSQQELSDQSRASSATPAYKNDTEKQSNVKA